MKTLGILRRRPSLFFNLAGIRIADFDDLVRKTYPLWLKNEHKRLSYKGRQRAIGAGSKLLPPRILKPGNAVSISGGPFAEFVATVEKISPDQRVWVLLDLMGRTTPVAVNPEALQVV